MSRRILLALVFALSLTGCATHAHVLEPVRACYYGGHLANAEAKIDEAIAKHPREADVLTLDRAMILLSEGRAKEAEQLMRGVRDHFDDLDQKNLAAGVLSMLTDDQRLPYPGEDYEKVLVRVFLAMSSLLGNGEDASAYALQVAAKQQEIIQNGAAPDGKNPKEHYKQVPAGAYIHAALREETHQNYDDAARSLQLVCNWAPEFASGPRELERVKHGRHSEKGNGVLYVFTLVGRGPYKEERMEIPTTAALLVADRILSIAGKRSLPPTVAPIKVPRVVVPKNDVESVLVAVDNYPRGQTETLTDVGRMAVEQADANLPYVIGRAVARRVAKKAVIYGVKEGLKSQKDDILNIVLDVGGVIWEATESADTRCWGLLPERIQVLRLELPAGTHTLALQPTRASGVPVGSPQTVTVEVADGRNTYTLASFPTGQLAGQIVTTR